MLLKNKKILLAVTGSIAIYKALELIRLYIKAGAIVKVIMTDSAKKFINPITFEAISQNRVLEKNTESWDKNSDYNHIDIGKWADIFVIAPASANTINKISNGIADNLLTQTVLAYPKIKILSPAANTNMITNPITQNSIKNLKLANFKIVQTQIKELACKDVGDGAMAEPQEIFYETARELLKDQYWSNREVVLSGGGTIEKIDDVRYISNFSSGKMASSLSLALYLKGANVTLVSTRGYENLPNSINVIPVQSSLDMYESLVSTINLAKNKMNKSKKVYLFMVAAISDYLPLNKEEGKLKKELLGNSWDLKLKQNIDILNTLEKSELISIGFKAETDETVAFENAQNMLVNKNLDAVCLNVLNEENTFGSNNNKIELILKDKSFSFSASKIELSSELLNYLKNEFNEY
ncbi:bifunctional phosphopantothenoylcysteine decarboxylase/phosphopantothenate--cysteine ligase CoaBC [Malaciobacter molluscorum LMG 25693]|uniref:Coenzyme A biosynthesis bifunctional protein CoaBC n=1 Tax=Malaciobacter molluscorum LMG 25693 TaxID=870501 RepID=A0A2G1DET5_9BACT|nr:bifunctional phosphopantothenoylcysteine decarboxylase/phosphopantothenate--cysteine ligase CoaBC [Malaciobacter molluscorum]AXX93533.1 phosphopantothenoylcysteine decarboxylase/phosphopantothenate--cysteine ligase [Malaciobacter molluscorum LMG 25693]PHO16993.1 bifunctional phosphopantothenoylcysteine decarboxylase/phosphopantothenate--cysteine ligase CoaBC [Malaciobacter molluscorum LMG 25693]